MSEEEDIKLAEGYWLNSLDAAARQLVESRARQEPAFQKLLEDTGVLISGIQATGRANLQHTIEQWETAYAKPKSKFISMRAWAAVGIAAIIILGISFLLWDQSSPPDSLALFKEYYQPYPNVVMPTVRGVKEDSSQLSKAYLLYDRGVFSEAAELFNTLPEKNAAVYLYLGNCWLALGDHEKAIESFNRCIAFNDSFQSQAEWFLALSFLKANDQKKTEEVLQRIVGRKNSYSERSEILLSKLKP
jgi:tetratricopeptide (TPR) repeat protein